MAINKVVYGADTLLDLTEDTVTEDKVLKGETFHDRSGVSRTGNVNVPVPEDITVVDEFISYNGGRVKSAQMELKPIQDLHGYPNPWVGGAGKNLLPTTVSAIKSLNTSGTWSGNVYTVSDATIEILTDDANNVIGIKANGSPSANIMFIVGMMAEKPSVNAYLNGCPVGGSNTTYHLTANGAGNDTGSGITIIPASSWNKYVSIYLYSGYTANNLIFNPMVRLSGDDTFEPYENKCPISGHTQAKLEQRGKNLLSGIEQGSLDTYGGTNSSTTRIRTKEFIKVDSATEYTVSSESSIQIYMLEFDEIGNERINSPSWVDLPVTFTTLPTTKYFKAMFRYSNDANITPSYAKNCQLEFGSTATDYEPYQGKDYIINLGGTYYWLRGDVVTGKWYVIGQGADLGTFTWTREQWGAGWDFYTLVNGIKRTSDYDDVTSSLCEQYKPVSRNTMYDTNEDGIMAVMSINNALKIRDTRYSDSDTFKTAVSGVKVVYELATPIPLSLTPQLIESLVGENHFSAPLQQQEIIEIIARNIAEFNEVIDDENVSEDFTYSSEKIESRLDDISDEVADEYVSKDSFDEQTATDTFETINGGLLSECKVTLSPIQDLHGYSEPWVGGSRKNKLELNIDTIKELNTAGTWSGNNYTLYGVTYSVITDNGGNIIEINVNSNSAATATGSLYLKSLPQLTDNTDYIMNGCPSGGSDSTYRLGYSNMVNYAYSDTGSGVAIRKFDETTYPNARVAIAIFSGYTANDLKFHPMIRLSTESDPTFEPYSNICPISGHTESKVGDDGKNRLPNNLYSDGSSGNLSWSKSSDGKITIKATANNPSATRIDIGSVTLPSGSYILSGISNTSSQRVELRLRTGSVTGTDFVTCNAINTNVTFTLNEKTTLYGVFIVFANFVDEVIASPMIRKLTDSADFEPYLGNIYVINLGGTYYSGTLDVVSGVFVPDTAEVDPGTLAWTYDSETQRFAAAVTGLKLYPVRTEPMECEVYQVITDGRALADVPDGSIYNGANSTNVWVHDSRFTTASDLATALSGYKLVYPLATPTPIQLSPTIVKALVGENHLSAPLDGQEITESKYRELFTWDEVEEIAQKIADSKIDNLNTSYDTTFSSAFTEARYVKKVYEVPALTALQYVLSGAPSITFNHQLIFSDAQTCCELIQFGSGARIGITDVAISQGSVTFTFDSPLTKAIGFRCRITNDFVS